MAAMTRSDAALADLPDVVARVLADFVSAAREAFGEDLVAVVLFGSAAEAALRPTSDVNVIVVLARFEREAADRVRPAVVSAQAAIGLRAMFLRRDEIAGAATAFAQKFADVRRRHRVLWGEDPFAGMQTARAALVARTNQVLLNLALRLRAAYVERGDRDEDLVALVADAAGPLRTAAATIVELEGGGAVRPKDALRRLAPSLALSDADRWLERLSQARENRTLADGAAGETVLALGEVAERLRARLSALG